MKIAIVSLDNSDQILVGGKHVHQILLSMGLKTLGNEIIKLFPKRSLSYLFQRAVLAVLAKMRFVSRASIYDLTLKEYCRSIEKQLKKETNLDVIFAQDPVAACAATELSKKIPVILTLHGYLGRESVNYGSFDEDEKKAVLKSAYWYEKTSLQIAKSVIVVDTKIGEYIRQEFKFDGAIKVLKNAIDPDIFGKTKASEIGALKEKLQISATKNVVLIPRRLVRKNGVDIAISALKKIKEIDEENPFVFLVAGEGPEYTNLVKQRDRLSLTNKDLIFLGSVTHSEVAKFYDMADVVMIPSVVRDGVEEATSLSMLEGMAAKKIVVVSNIGGMKEVIRSGENGFSFTQGDEKQLANLLLSILKLSMPDKQEIQKCAYDDICKDHHFMNHSRVYLEQASQS